MSGIRFYNIRNGESRNCNTEPQIAAFWGSSDRSPNAMQGQDYGWRLAPEVIDQVNRLKNHKGGLKDVADSRGIAVNDVVETDILEFLAAGSDDLDQSPEAFKKAYEAEVRALEERREKESEVRAEEEAKVQPEATPAPVEKDEAPEADEEPVQHEEVVTPELKTVEGEEAEKVEDAPVEDALLAKTRAELNEIAAGQGIADPEKYQNKEELAAAIRAA